MITTQKIISSLCICVCLWKHSALRWKGAAFLRQRLTHANLIFCRRAFYLPMMMVMRWRSPLRAKKQTPRPWLLVVSRKNHFASVVAFSAVVATESSLARSHRKLFVWVRAPAVFCRQNVMSSILSAGWESNILHHFTSLESKQWANKSPAMGGSGPEKAENALAVWSGDGRRILSAAEQLLIANLSLSASRECMCVCERGSFLLGARRNGSAAWKEMKR